MSKIRKLKDKIINIDIKKNTKAKRNRISVFELNQTLNTTKLHTCFEVIFLQQPPVEKLDFF